MSAAKLSIATRDAHFDNALAALLARIQREMKPADRRSSSALATGDNVDWLTALRSAFAVPAAMHAFYSSA